MATKSKRIVYSVSDCHRLADIVLNYKNIVECKKTDATTWKEKNAAWEKIAQCYNSSTTEARTSEQLRSKFDNMKKEVRRYEALARQSLHLTGGGPSKPEIKASIKLLYDKIKSIISFSVTVLESSNESSDCINIVEKEPNCDQMIGSPSQPFEMDPGNDERQLVSNDMNVMELKEPEIEINKNCSNYTPKMLRSNKHKALQVKRNRIETEVDVEDENQNYEKKMFDLKRELLEKEAAREESFHVMKMEMEQELYKQKIRNEMLQSEKLKLEIAILKKQL